MQFLHCSVDVLSHNRPCLKPVGGFGEASMLLFVRFATDVANRLIQQNTSNKNTLEVTCISKRCGEEEMAFGHPLEDCYLRVIPRRCRQSSGNTCGSVKKGVVSRRGVCYSCGVLLTSSWVEGEGLVCLDGGVEGSRSPNTVPENKEELTSGIRFDPRPHKSWFWTYERKAHCHEIFSLKRSRSA